MNTPIIDFVKKYGDSSAVRFHMPGHKGVGADCKGDITEIPGADSLYEARGIIMESERNAGELFGADTFYSAEGASLAIRGMLYLVTLYTVEKGAKPLILAGRNAHRSFVSSAALLDFDIKWIYPEDSSYMSCKVSPQDIEKYFEEELPLAVYLTCPDYLGNMCDIGGIAKVCRERGVLLIVDNAHGAYLKFLHNSLHPIDLGADMCCDSAHKTLPCLTGGAYLHISKNAPKIFSERAKDSLSLFGSTSPSYLILASLDGVNGYIADGYREKLGAFLSKLDKIKSEILSLGFDICGDEPMKITLCPKSYGYYGQELSEILSENGIITEFSDPDFTVFMPTPQNSDEDLSGLLKALSALQKREKITDVPPSLHIPVRAMGIREAMMQKSEILPVEKCVGRIVSVTNAACPPAVPIILPGEVVDSAATEIFRYYEVSELCVVKEH